MAKAFDIVVYGATGFTGGLVTEYLAQHAPAGTRWAVAGRDEKKLWTIREKLDAAPRPPSDSMKASSSDFGSLRAIAERAQVVLTTVGPYVQHGEPVVRAAVEGEADYVDIAGEPTFVSMILERYHDQAEKKGLRLVSCCGFDSVPHDLGALFCAQQLPHDAPMTIEAFVRSRGGISGGTWHSAIGIVSNLGSMMGRRRAPAAGSRKVRALPLRPRYVSELESWAVPLPTIDPEIVLRSAGALDVFGPDFAYGHYARTRNLGVAVGGAVAAGGVIALAQLKQTREMLLSARKPGEGPSAEERAKNWFEVTFIGEAASRKAITTVSGGDPGYGETAKMVSESALCLAKDRALLPARSGALTPAVAMGDLLRQRLERAGIRFQVKEQR